MRVDFVIKVSNGVSGKTLAIAPDFIQAEKVAYILAANFTDTNSIAEIWYNDSVLDMYGQMYNRVWHEAIAPRME